MVACVVIESIVVTVLVWLMIVNLHTVMTAYCFAFVRCIKCGAIVEYPVLLKWYCDENHIFPIEPILKHKQVACMTRKMLFTIFKYLFSFQRYLSF